MSLDSSKVVVWEALDKSYFGWICFDPLECQKIESAYQRFLADTGRSSQTAEYTTNTNHVIYFSSSNGNGMQQQNRVTGMIMNSVFVRIFDT